MDVGGGLVSPPTCVAEPLAVEDVDRSPGLLGVIPRPVGHHGGDCKVDAPLRVPMLLRESGAA
jgi:hypothetical protein